MPRIVVGVDGSKGSKAALRFALDEARRRRASLHVVHAWKHSAGALHTYYTGGAGTRLGGFTKTRAQAEQRSLMCFVHTTVPAADVEMSITAVEGDPARVLLEAAHGADMLVAGSRGHGGFASLMLGSVSQQCAHHAPCPVVIVHGEAK